MAPLVENCLEIQGENFLVNLDVENFEYVHPQQKGTGFT